MVSGNFSSSMRGTAKLVQPMLVKEGVAAHILITDWAANIRLEIETHTIFAGLYLVS